MWDDFLIGKKVHRGGGTTRVLMSSCLSENSNEYWYNSKRYFIGGVITKDCDEGKEIKKLVTKIYNLILNGPKRVPSLYGERPEDLNDKDDKKIDDLVFSLAVKHKPSLLMKVINKVKDAAFLEGVAHNQTLIRSALGL